MTIIDERLAREYWPNESPIGRRIRFGPPEDNEPWHTIVGVVGTVRHERMQEDTEKSVYLPHVQIPVNGMALVTRTYFRTKRAGRQPSGAKWRSSIPIYLSAKSRR